MNRLGAILSSFVIVVVLASCAHVGSSSAPAPGQSQGLSMSWAQAYPSIAEMTAHADAIVVGQVQEESGTSTDQGIPYTDFKYSVITWIIGKPDSSIISIHQAGNKSSQVDDDPLLQPGESNLLFLRKYATGKYFIMGGPTGRLLTRDGTVDALPEGHAKDGLPAELTALTIRIKSLEVVSTR